MGGIDVEIGRRLRALRQARGMTMEQVAVLIGVRYQQIQKYEAGSNRVSAGRLFRFAQLLEVPVNTFFENVELATDQQAHETTGLDSRGLRLAYEFNKLPEPQKRAVLSLVQSMSDKPEVSGQQDGS